MRRLSRIARLVGTAAAAIAVPALFMSPLGDPVRERVSSRAAVLLEDGFDQPLEGWFGARDWSHAWSRDPSGFVRVGQLALFRPSLQLSDYRFEFTAQIEHESLGWVYRASGLSNYYAARLIVVKPGPRPLLALERYAVVGGEVSQRIQMPLRERIDVRKPLHIAVEVEGDGFRTWIEDIAVDFWRDQILHSGGVGFFGSPADRPQIFGMQVRHNDDMLGRFCSLLAKGA